MQHNVIFSAVFVVFFVCCSCVYKGELNDPCQIVQECRHFAYLCSRNRTCQCIYPLFRPNKYWDKCVGIVGQRCEYDDHCIEGAWCKDRKICECKNDFVPSEDNTECSHSSRNTPTKYTIIPVLILIYLKQCFG